LTANAALLLPGQPQLDHLHRRQALAGGVMRTVDEHRNARGEVGDFLVVAHDRQHRVDRFTVTRLDR
jgi:hypothetical protein